MHLVNLRALNQFAVTQSPTRQEAYSEKWREKTNKQEHANAFDLFVARRVWLCVLIVLEYV